MSRFLPVDDRRPWRPHVHRALDLSDHAADRAPVRASAPAARCRSEGVIPDRSMRRHAAARRGSSTSSRRSTTRPPSRCPRTRREEIAEIARRHDLTIIEDDVFRYFADDAPPTIYSMAPERTYYIQSVSKTMARRPPGRLHGDPADAGGEVIRQQMIVGGRPVSLSLEVARRWIEDGVADRILAAIREELAPAASWRLTFSAAIGPVRTGSHVCLADPPGSLAAGGICGRRPDNGVKLTPGPAFAMDHTHQVRSGPAWSCRRRESPAARDWKGCARLLDRGPVEEFQTMA